MKTNKIALIFTMLSVFALAITPVFANGIRYDSELIAGQNKVVGGVDLYFDVEDNDHDLLHIKLVSDCEIVETHIWVGEELTDVPRTKSGNPKIGQFPYSSEPLADEFIQDIDTSELEGTIYVLIHAVVDCPCGEETAWADTFGTPFSERPDIFGNRWGYFLEIEI